MVHEVNVPTSVDASSRATSVQLPFGLPVSVENNCSGRYSPVIFWLAVTVEINVAAASLNMTPV